MDKILSYAIINTNKNQITQKGGSPYVLFSSQSHPDHFRPCRVVPRCDARRLKDRLQIVDRLKNLSPVAFA
jgi:hypothetical protein